MGYEAERIGIQNWMQGQSPAFFGLSPFGLDGEVMSSLVSDSGFLTIVNGEARRKSVGIPGGNRHVYIGVAMVTIVADTPSEGKVFADLFVEAMTNLKIDGTGVAASPASTTVIDFGYNGLAPYIANGRREEPFYRIVVNAPFARIERK